MKTYVLLAAFYFLFLNPSTAKIRNGYANNIESARASLRNLRILLNEDRSLSVFQRLTIYNKIADLTEFITYHDLTDLLLNQFRTISPDLYYEVDSIKDRLGRNPDVFVKFVPEKEMPGGVAGETMMDSDQHDKDACLSQYGIHTISINISVVKKSLFLLAHEFGHARYQAPNLQAYRQFYTKFYLASTYKAISRGHNDRDLSGQHAMNFTKRFRKQYLDYLKVDGQKIASHLALLQGIKDEVRQ